MSPAHPERRGQGSTVSLCVPTKWGLTFTHLAGVGSLSPGHAGTQGGSSEAVASHRRGRGVGDLGSSPSTAGAWAVTGAGHGTAMRGGQKPCWGC